MALDQASTNQGCGCGGFSPQNLMHMSFCPTFHPICPYLPTDSVRATFRNLVMTIEPVTRSHEERLLVV